MHFRIQGLPAEQFAPLFAMSDAALAERGAVRRIADARERGYPCRVSLADSNPGDELILVNYEHHAVASPYRMRFAIYVRKGDETFDAIDTVPEQLRGRTLAVRAFDADGMMAGWDLVEGDQLEDAVTRPVGRAARGLSACALRRARLLRGSRRASLKRWPSHRLSQALAAPKLAVHAAARYSAWQRDKTPNGLAHDS
jgi:uncharacterized protein DUF1203